MLLGVDLGGMKVALDAANGAAAVSARNIFLDLNAEIAAGGDQPDGLNINAGVGSTHPEQLPVVAKPWLLGSAQQLVLPLMETVTVSSLLMKMVILMVTR